MLYVETYDKRSHLINPKYIVSADEILNGYISITLESGARYIVDETIWGLMTSIKKDEEKFNE